LKDKRGPERKNNVSDGKYSVEISKLDLGRCYGERQRKKGAQDSSIYQGEGSSAKNRTKNSPSRSKQQQEVWRIDWPAGLGGVQRIAKRDFACVEREVKECCRNQADSKETQSRGGEQQQRKSLSIRSVKEVKSDLTPSRQKKRGPGAESTDPFKEQRGEPIS